MMNFPEPYTDAERAAIEILRNAKLETDDDYRALVKLLDDNGYKHLDNTDGEASE